MKDYHVLIQVDITKPATVSNKVYSLPLSSILGELTSSKILDLPDVPWAKKQLWAPDATEKDGKYYLFFPAKDPEGVFRIGVATSDTPDGKFKAEKNYIPGAYSIDPAVLADDDGSYHLYFGGIWGGQLQAWNNNTLV